MNKLNIFFQNYFYNKELSNFNILIFTFIFNFIFMFSLYWINNYDNFSFISGDWGPHWSSILFDGANYRGCNFICSPYPIGFFFKYIELTFGLSIYLALIVFSLTLYLIIYFSQKLIRLISKKYSLLILLFLYLSPTGFIVTLTYYKDVFMLLSLVISYYIFLKLLSEKEKKISEILFYILLYIFACLVICLSRHPAINLLFLINIVFLCTFFIKVLISQNNYLKNNVINVLLFTFIVSVFTIDYHFETKFEQDGLSFSMPKLSVKYFNKYYSIEAIIAKIKNKNDIDTSNKELLTVEDLLVKITKVDLIQTSKIKIVDSYELIDNSENTDKVSELENVDTKSDTLKERIEETKADTEMELIVNYFEGRNIEINKHIIATNKLKDNSLTEIIINKKNSFVKSQKAFIKNAQFLKDSSYGNAFITLYNSLLQPSPFYVLKYSTQNLFIKIIIAFDIFITNFLLLGLLFIGYNKYRYEQIFILISSIAILYIILSFQSDYGSFIRHKYFFWKILASIGIINLFAALNYYKILQR